MIWGQDGQSRTEFSDRRQLSRSAVGLLHDNVSVTRMLRNALSYRQNLPYQTRRPALTHPLSNLVDLPDNDGRPLRRTSGMYHTGHHWLAKRRRLNEVLWPDADALGQHGETGCTASRRVSYAPTSRRTLFLDRYTRSVLSQSIFHLASLGTRTCLPRTT